MRGWETAESSPGFPRCIRVRSRARRTWPAEIAGRGRKAPRRLKLGRSMTVRSKNAARLSSTFPCDMSCGFPRGLARTYRLRLVRCCRPRSGGRGPRCRRCHCGGIVRVRRRPQERHRDRRRLRRLRLPSVRQRKALPLVGRLPEPGLQQRHVRTSVLQRRCLQRDGKRRRLRRRRLWRVLRHANLPGQFGLSGRRLHSRILPSAQLRRQRAQRHRGGRGLRRRSLRSLPRQVALRVGRRLQERCLCAR